MHSILELFRFAAPCVNKTTSGTALKLPSLYDGVSCNIAGDVAPASIAEVFLIAWNLMRILIAVSGALAVIFLIVAAIYYITSAGDAGRTKKAKDMITNIVVGLVLIVVSYAVVTFISQGF